MSIKLPKQRIHIPLHKNTQRPMARETAAPDEEPLMPASLNDSTLLSAAQVLQLQRTIGNQAVLRLLGRQQPALQRKAYIGQKGGDYTEYQPQDGDSGAVKKLAKDKTTRRFNDKKELDAFAAGSLDNMGYLSEHNVWVRLDQFTVVGEDHTDPAAPLIQATKTHRFRYEGFSELPPKRLQFDALANHIRKRDKGAFKRRKLVRDTANHAAEDVVPKLARVLPDMNALIQNQPSDGEPDDLVKGIEAPNLKAGDHFKKGYSLTKALNRGFLDALVYLTSYEDDQSTDPLSTFYQAHKDAVNASIKMLKQVGKNNVPNYQKLPIVPLMSALIAAYEKTAIADMTTDNQAFKAELETTDESRVTLTNKAKELDYLRDQSMYEKILAAKNTDLLFIIGEAHRKKLNLLLAKEGIENLFYDILLHKQEMEDKNARGS